MLQNRRGLQQATQHTGDSCLGPQTTGLSSSTMSPTSICLVATRERPRPSLTSTQTPASPAHVEPHARADNNVIYLSIHFVQTEPAPSSRLSDGALQVRTADLTVRGKVTRKQLVMGDDGK